MNMKIYHEILVYTIIAVSTNIVLIKTLVIKFGKNIHQEK